MAKQYVIKNSNGVDKVYTNIDTVVLTDTEGNETMFVQKDIYDNSNAFVVTVIDYDGTVLKSEKLMTGGVFSLPEPPLHDRLEFAKWVCPTEIVENQITVTDCDLTIGACYRTKTGLSEFDVSIPSNASSFKVSLNISGTKNWGDGTTDTASSHTYASAGDYIITCDGKYISSYIFECPYFTKIRIGDSVVMHQNSFSGSSNKKNISSVSFSPTSSASTGQYVAFNNFTSVNGVVLPFEDSMVSLSGCYGLEYVALSPTVRFYVQSFFNCRSLKYINIPKNLTNFNSQLFSSCSALERIKIPDTVTTFDNSVFSECTSLKEVIIPDSVTSLTSGTFSRCYMIKNININRNITQIPSSIFEYCYSLRNIRIFGDVTSVGTTAFANMKSLKSISFENCTSVPTASATNGGILYATTADYKIYVPDSLYDEWRTATNWVSYQKYIYKISDMEE